MKLIEKIRQIIRVKNIHRQIASVLLLVFSINLSGNLLADNFTVDNIFHHKQAEIGQQVDDFIITSNVNLNKPEKNTNLIEAASLITSISRLTRYNVFLITHFKNFSFTTRFKTFLAAEFSTGT